ncbi:hypothetical protein [Mycobacterium sp. Aquia_213]|uniref:hypothetical protein n=1 Tax=Mycobacterium sp. Aquia_213 TaxID=2991728 RepID=UPI00226EB857|nr:hypothetical protein [Mycobacterium sp. Aquia_213]WAC89702.1 hypothetical protein LMQ14_17290 [Mycobacterium sp. Aquia_213]
MDDEWQVVEGTGGWMAMPGFGEIDPRRDNEAGGRQYFTAKTDNGEVAQAKGEFITEGPATWHYVPDSPFWLADSTGRCVEVEISHLPGGCYAVNYRPGHWPTDLTGGW